MAEDSYFGYEKDKVALESLLGLSLHGLLRKRQGVFQGDDAVIIYNTNFQNRICSLYNTAVFKMQREVKAQRSATGIRAWIMQRADLTLMELLDDYPLAV